MRRDIRLLGTSGFMKSWTFRSDSLKNCSHGTITKVLRDTISSPDLVSWSDIIWNRIFQEISRNDGWIVMLKTHHNFPVSCASISSLAFTLLSKFAGGGVGLVRPSAPPPPTNGWLSIKNAHSYHIFIVGSSINHVWVRIDFGMHCLVSKFVVTLWGSYRSNKSAPVAPLNQQTSG